MAATEILNSDKESPLTAKQRFKMRGWVNFGYSLAILIVSVALLMQIMPEWMADVVALGIVAFVYFNYLHNRAITIRCPYPECGEIIKSNTPWKCGNPKCQKDNEQADSFSFVDRCQHCGVEQKAYQCHHCRKIIYFSEDKLKSFFATFVTNTVRKKPFPKNIAKENEDIRKTEQKLRKAKLDLELKNIKDELQPRKDMTEEEILEKSAARFKDRHTSGPKIVERWKAENARLYKDNPKEREKQDANANQWALNNLEKM